MRVTGFVALLTRQVACREFSQCYDNICLWTDGSLRTRSAAQRSCQQRNNSFLLRVTDSSVQSKLAEFRSDAGDLLGSDSLWIGLYVSVLDSFNWLDGSPLRGLYATQLI